ncbi:hypothetical protein ACOSP7_031009 [Xanthoceras sorbifolium]
MVPIVYPSIHNLLEMSYQQNTQLFYLILLSITVGCVAVYREKWQLVLLTHQLPLLLTYIFNLNSYDFLLDADPASGYGPFSLLLLTTKFNSEIDMSVLQTANNKWSKKAYLIFLDAYPKQIILP